MPDAAEVLTALRPAHLPPASAHIGVGDMLLPVTAGLMAALVLALVWPKRIKGRRRAAMSALDALTAARALPAPEAKVAVARLLRRMVREADGPAAAALPGPAFAAHLDARFSTDFFTQGGGRAITVSLYAPPEEHGGGEAETHGKLEALLSRMRA